MAAPFKLRKEDVEEHYFRLGKTIADVALQFDVSPETVIRCMRRHGLKARKRTVSQACRDASSQKLFKGFGEISGTYMNGVKRNARVRNLPMEVEAEYLWDLFLTLGRRCALSGQELKFSPVYRTTHLKLQTASLDRIDSSKGYVVGNVQWLHKDVQAMKSNFTDEHYIQVCRQVAAYRAS